MIFALTLNNSNIHMSDFQNNPVYSKNVLEMLTVANDYCLTLSKSEETSLESSGLRQGVFSHFLIRGLKGEADVDANKVVSIIELYNFINDNVRSYTGLRQSPVLKGDYDDKMTVSVIR